jgi:hypothetical protein
MPTHEIGCLHHCPRRGGGIGWLLILVAIAVLVVGAVCYKARHAISTGLNVIAVIGEVILWMVVAGFGLGLLAGTSLLIRAIVRRVQETRDARPVPRTALAEPVHRITQIGTPAAVEAPRTGWQPSRTENWVPAREQEVDSDSPRAHSRFR